MPRAGLAEPARELVRAAVADEQTLARFRAKIVTVPGSHCTLLWSGAVSGRGLPGFWVGTVAGRGVVVIAHRFAWAITYGVDALEEVPMLGHRCDNPLVRREVLVDRVEVKDLHRRPVAAGRLKLGAV